MSSPRTFTHMLHPRYRLMDDLMNVSLKPGSALRVAFLKLKSENEIAEVFELVGGFRHQFEMIEHFSCVGYAMYD
ncbi:hypothetical protein Tco_1411827 [Tanacetum coccineum]